MTDDSEDFGLQDFENYAQADDGFYANLRVDANRLATIVARASRHGWEYLGVTPYRLKANDGESVVEEYMLLLRQEK